MIRLAIVVEGATEQMFVGQVLADHLRRQGAESSAVLVGGDGGRQGGGNVNVARVAATMSRLYWSFDIVTSLVDFYGFTRKGGASANVLEEKIRKGVEAQIRHGWDERKVLPYVQRHEFEALLFADVAAFSSIDVPEKGIRELQGVRSRFETPEDINDDHATAPSKRIVKTVPSYDKVVSGPLIASEIGLDKMRSACPRFDAWLRQLESLAVLWQQAMR